MVAHCKRGSLFVLVYCGMRRVLAVGEQEELGEVRCLELAHYFASYQIAVRIYCLGRLQANQADSARHVCLPAAEQN